MGLGQDMEIVLDKALYHPGDTISGKVMLSVEQPTEFDSIGVRARGEAKVHWTEGLGDKCHREETVLNTKQTVVGRATQSNSTLENVANPNLGCYSRAQLKPGRHEFAFRLETLPEALPNSFYTEYGQIFYWVEAELQTHVKSRQSELLAKKFITVIDGFSSSNPEATSLVMREGEVEPSKGNFVTISVQTDRYGYHPEDTINVTFEIENASNRGAKPIAELVQEIEYCAGGEFDTKTFTKVLRNCVGPELRAGNQNWTGKIPIPKNDVYEFPTITECPIIGVEYWINAKIGIGADESENLTLPIRIGHKASSGSGGFKTGTLDNKWIAGRTTPDNPADWTFGRSRTPTKFSSLDRRNTSSPLGYKSLERGSTFTKYSSLDRNRSPYGSLRRPRSPESGYNDSFDRRFNSTLNESFGSAGRKLDDDEVSIYSNAVMIGEDEFSNDSDPFHEHHHCNCNCVKTWLAPYFSGLYQKTND